MGHWDRVFKFGWAGEGVAGRKSKGSVLEGGPALGPMVGTWG